MNILATPLRYLDIAFLAFDITGDGEIEAKVRTRIDLVLKIEYSNYCSKNVAKNNYIA